MALLQRLDDSVIAFSCPGCGNLHSVYVDKPNPKNGAQWTWNGKFDKPTFYPSVKTSITHNDIERVLCHCYVENGFIRYLNDCEHKLAGKTVTMEEIDE